LGFAPLRAFREHVAALHELDLADADERIHRHRVAVAGVTDGRVGRSARSLAVARSEHEQDHGPAHAADRNAITGIHRAAFAWGALACDEATPPSLTPVLRHTNFTTAYRARGATMAL